MTDRKVSYWYGGRSAKELFYLDEFEELAKLVNEAQGDETVIKELEEKNEALVDERKKQIEAVKDMLEDTITVDLTYIGEDVLPKTLNAKQLKGLQRLIL